MTVSRDYFISENNFEEEMHRVAVPFLEEHKTDSYFEAEDGKKIHFVYYKADNARGNMIISHGFTESGEKFEEMAYYFLRMRLNVFVPDHRGHGYSHRHNSDPQVVHIKSFDKYVTDLNTLIKKVVSKNEPGLPLYLYAHSMGGAIAVQHLQCFPGTVQKAVLSAPMIKARTAGVPEAVANFAARTFILLGKEKEKVMGYKPFNPNRTYEESHDTSKARFDYYQKKRVANEKYQTSSPSYRWVSEAVKVSKLNLDPERNKKVTAKILLCQPEEDSSVISEAEDEFIKLVKDGRLERFYNCKHEIYMSVDDTVKQYLDTIENFLFDE